MHRAVSLIAVASFALPATAASEPAFEGPVARADCGPGSQPEPPNALQGEVTARDRASGRSLRPYTCNMALVGNESGPGASWQHTWYGDCAYYDTKFSSGRGTQVVDGSDPARPKAAPALTSTAMLDPWESLSVHQGRGLLGGVSTNSGFGPLIFEVYDVRGDCAKPRMLFSGPVSGFNHEGDWAADGRTFWATGTLSPTISAIDVADPSAPRAIGTYGLQSHGLSTSVDGTRLYLAGNAGTAGGNGLTIVDVGDIQRRVPNAQPRVVSSVTWNDGSAAQHTIPVTFDGRPYVLFVDELSQGAARFIDISDEAKPRVVSKLKLEIHMPDNRERGAETGSGNLFGYNAHYCNVDRRTDPTIVVCSMFQSGMRVFDVRDPMRPREIAYFNPGGTGEAPKSGSQDNSNPITSAYASARPRIVEERGEIWFTDQNKGFFVARFTNGVWPFETGAAADLGLPPGGGPPPRAAAGRRCTSRRDFHVRVRAPRGQRLRSASVYVNDRRVSTVAGRRLRARVDLRGLPQGAFRVTIVARTTKGRTIRRTRSYRTCTARRR